MNSDLGPNIRKITLLTIFATIGLVISGAALLPSYNLSQVAAQQAVSNAQLSLSMLKQKEQEIMGSGDKVISVVKVTGKHTGDFFVIPPSGNRISYQAVHIHRIDDDGKIVEHRSIRDEPLFQAWKEFKDTQ
ncbi:MAG: ester cyclase [Candidatus Nitrosopolaris sp.]|jgi:hypothetical protein